jgi:hypothetical protein
MGAKWRGGVQGGADRLEGTGRIEKVAGGARHNIPKKVRMTNCFEEISKEAQKYLSEGTVIILGSGASVSYGLPSMIELGNELVASVKPTEHNALLWERFIKEFEVCHDVEKALNLVQLSEDLLDQITRVTWRYIGFWDLKLYQELLENVTSLALTRALQFFLRVANPQISVVTTNYDRIAEYASNIAGAHVYTGFSPGWIQQSSSQSWSKARRQVKLWKVHGSLDWFEREDGEIIGIPLSTQIPSGLRPVVVTPGITKYQHTHREPFRSVIAQADQALSSAGSFLCIGYGFNDEHIQPKLIARIHRYNVPVVVLTYKLTDAARKLLLTTPCRRYLLIEACDSGSRAYSTQYPQGTELPGRIIWQLDNFLETILEAGE